MRREGGICPEIWLSERTMVLRRWRRERETGKSPEKLFWLRNKDLRFFKPERDGIWPDKELDLRLRTRSWSSWLRLVSFSCPVKLKCSSTSFVTLPLMHCLIPSQLQTSVVVVQCKELDGSIEDFRVERASKSSDLISKGNNSRLVMKKKKEEGFEIGPIMKRKRDLIWFGSILSLSLC